MQASESQGVSIPERLCQHFWRPCVPVGRRGCGACRCTLIESTRRRNRDSIVRPATVLDGEQSNGNSFECRSVVAGNRAAVCASRDLCQLAARGLSLFESLAVTLGCAYVSAPCKRAAKVPTCMCALQRKQHGSKGSAMVPQRNRNRLFT